MRGLVAILLVAASFPADGLTAPPPLSTLSQAQPVSTPAVITEMSASGLTRGLLDCAQAVEIAQWGLYDGSNGNFPNNVIYYDLIPISFYGGEAVFHLSLAEPTEYRVSLTSNGCVHALALLDQCDEQVGFIGLFGEEGYVTAGPVSGDFYLVVDSWVAPGCEFTLQIFEIPPTGVPEDYTWFENQESRTWSSLKAHYR